MAEAFSLVEGVLVNKGTDLHMKGVGSIRYEGRWELIDMFMVSPEIDKVTQMEVCRVPFLMTWEKKHPGEKPLRTYSGPRYIGGVSDHCINVCTHVYFKSIYSHLAACFGNAFLGLLKLKSLFYSLSLFGISLLEALPCGLGEEIGLERLKDLKKLVVNFIL